MRLLVDVSGLVYRSAYKLHLTDREGRNVGAAYGTIKTLGHLADVYEPDEMVICWDAGHELQTKLYPAYKLDRHKDPAFQADLVLQKGIIRSMTSHLPLVHLQEAGIEADDLIAVIARFLHMEDVGVVTSDSDLHCLTTKRCMMIGPDGVRSKLELEPDQFIPYKVLVGGEDNIKGVAGVGDVKARKLLAEHGTLDAILRFSDEQGGLGKMNAAQVRDEVARNLQLMTPGALLSEEKRHAIVNQYIHGRLERSLDQQGFRAALMEHGFVSIVSRLRGFLMPFRRMERQRNGQAKAQAQTPSEGGAESRAERANRDQGLSRKAWTRYVRKVESCIRTVCKVDGREGSSRAGRVQGGPGVEGERGPATRAAQVLARLRAQAPLGLAASGDRQGAAGVVRHGVGQARARGAGGDVAPILHHEGVLPKQPSGGEALSVLHRLRTGEGWAWLKSRPTQDLQRVLRLFDQVLKPGKAVPVDDHDFLLGLEEAFGSDMPPWMKTEGELKRDATRILKHKHLHQEP